jgi:uncharacterized protein YecE (DUF72 family)
MSCNKRFPGWDFENHRRFDYNRERSQVNMTLQYGPAGWSYADWQGPVYPHPQPKGFDQLAFIAARFDFVEVNTTFYRTPSLKMTTGWVKKTRHRPDFVFWIKLHQDITHARQLDQHAIQSFSQAIAPLQDAGKLAGVLAQFPYSFHATQQNGEFIRRLLDAMPQRPLAIEFRHQGWNRPNVLEFFKLNQVVFVNVDQPQVSESLPLTAYAPHAQIAYFRLHGRNASNWFSDQGRDARYDYDYSAMELQSIASLIQKLKTAAKKISSPAIITTRAVP